MNARSLLGWLKGNVSRARRAWRRHWFLLRTFRNGFAMIQHYRRRTPCERAVCWDGTILRHPAGRMGLIETILEVWCDQTYTAPFYRPAPGDVVIDAGANIGLFSVWMARTYPACRVLAFEPFGENFTLLEENVSASRARLEARLGALGGATGRGHMTDGGKRSLDHRLSLEDCGELGPALPVYSFADVLQIANAERVALFKIDIEGSEYDLIAQADPRDLNRVSRFAIEYHDNLRAGTLDLLQSRLSSTHRIDVYPASAGYGMLYATHREACAT